MNYRHAYHAGNFADVMKHAILIVLLRALAKKDTPFFVLDAHAGRGSYDLRDPKLHEHKQGVNKLRPEDWAKLPDYRAAVADPAKTYPGSPRIIRHFLRPQDRLALVELHPDEYAALTAEFERDPQVGVHQRDSYEALRALVPPKEKRGLVHLDPAFEVADEFPKLATAIRDAHAKWSNGVYAVWYPRKSNQLVSWFRKTMEASKIRKIFAAELDPKNQPMGSGMMIINPPYQTDEAIRQTLELLGPALDAETRASWWVPE